MTKSQQHTFHYWQDQSLQVLRIYQGSVSPEGRDLETHCTHLTAWRLEKGSAEIHILDHVLHARANDWVFLPSGLRTQKFSRDARIWSANFRLLWPDKRSGVDLRPGLVLRGQDVEKLNLAADAVTTAIGKGTSEGGIHLHSRCTRAEAFRVDAAFLSWLALAVDLCQTHLPGLLTRLHPDPRLEKARVFLESASLAQPLDFDALSDTAGLSVAHLNRLFLNQHQVTTHGYFQERRLLHARERLLDRETPIKDIAEQLGFSHLSKFSNWFKRLDGRSPRSYRQDFAGESS